jgi:hypothetical protein
MELNLLVRGQSNAILLMEAGGWAGHGALPAEVERLLGFDGVNDRVNLVYGRDWASGTAFGGTALIGDWLTPSGTGWAVAGREAALLNEVRSLPGSQRDDPTAVLWLHSEYDSANRGLTADQWVSAVRFEAAQLREAFGQGAATVPYLFVSAMPYWGTEEGHNAIRIGMERLAAEPGFNAHVAARMLDIDADGDADGSYGGGHIDAADAMQTVMRAARGIAEALAAYAKPGSPVALAGGNIADDGPMAVAATPVGADALRIDLRHDVATRLAPLDPDAARGVGWEVIGPGARVEGISARIEDADTLLVTFSGPLPSGGVLHYGNGYGRLAGADGSGRGNAVYDDQGLPAWVPATGLVPGAPAAPPPLTAAATGSAPPPPPPSGLLVEGGAGADNLRGGAGADTLLGGDAEDDLQGFGGNDVLAGGRGHDGLTLGAGADTVLYARGDGPDWVVDFEPGTDHLVVQGITAAEASFRPAAYWGMAGTELLLPEGSIFFQGVSAFRPGDATFDAGPPPPVLPQPVTSPAVSGRVVGGGSGADSLAGGAGADTISGGAGEDDLRGLDGDDVLRGGRDHDGLTGGPGRDTFVFARGDGADWVVDFQPGIDRIRLEGIAASSVVQTVETRWGMVGLELSFGRGGEMFLQGVSSRLATSDIVFA